MVPSSMSLFEPINSLVSTTYMMQIIGFAHALWLRYIDLLREMLIEKGIIYIKLAKAPLAMEYNAKNSTDSDGIYHETESLMKVNTRLLMKAFSNRSSFILCSRAIWILFDTKHPFFAHYIQPRAWGNKRLSTVPDESIIFFLHNLNPFQILESLDDSAGFKERGKYGSEAISRFGFGDGVFRAGLHGMKV